MNTRTRWLVSLSLVALYFIWGSTFYAMKLAIESFPPFMMAGLRFFCAGILLYAILRVRGQPAPGLRQWASAAVIGAMLLALGNASIAYAQQWVATGAAALAIATVPLWVAVFSGLWGNRPHLKEWLGILVGTAGVAVLTLGHNMQASPLGAALILFAALSWAFGSVWSKQLPMPEGLMSSAAQMLCAGTLLLLFSQGMGEPVPRHASTGAVLALLYLIVFGSYVAYTAYLYLLNTVRPALATSYAFVNPLVAMLLGTWLLGERLEWHEIAALCIILAGVSLVLWPKKTSP